MLSSKELKRLKNEFRHDCELVQDEDIVVRYINNGCCVDFRRKIRDSLMVDANSAVSKQYLKSNYVIRMERNRHLQFHYYMIHPFSKFRMWWEILMILVLTVNLMIIPIVIAIESQTLPLRWYQMSLDLICCVDICFTFTTGILNARNNKIIMKRKLVAKRYILGWFVSDFVSSLNVYLFWHMGKLVGLIVSNEYPNELDIVSYIKLLRIFTLLIYIDRIRKYGEHSVYKFKLYKILLIMSFIFIWGTSCVYLFEKLAKAKEGLKQTNDNQYVALLECYQKVVNMVLLFGYGQESTFSIRIMVVEMICVVIGYIVQLIVIAQILQIISKYSSASSKYYQMTQQLTEYMRFKNLPEALRKRIFTYFDFQFQRNFYKENVILNTLSTRLRNEILLQSSENLIENIHLFHDFPQSLIAAIVLSMKSEVFLPSDTIINAGSIGDSTYFIATGTVAIYTANGKEVCHISDGGNFGEIALVLENEVRTASVVAIDSCEIFILSRKDFFRIMEPYPELFYRVRVQTQDKLKRFVLSALRKGRDSDTSVASQHSREPVVIKPKLKSHYFV